MNPLLVRTLAVWCLDWPVAAAGQSPGVAIAVIYANRVVACSAAARAEGVQRGQRRREAQGRCPSLVVTERDESLEARQFEAIAAVCESFTPRVEITRPGTCLFPTRGPARYFGGDQALAVKVHEAVSGALGERTVCRIGIADGPFTAALAARAARSGSPVVVEPHSSNSFLAPLPVTTLEQPDLTDVLLRLGITKLGQLAALPRSDVLGRFGLLGEWAHRVASGESDRLPAVRELPPDVRVELVFDPPVERIEQAAFVARSLADELHGKLADRGLACTRLSIEVETEQGERLSRLWRHEGMLSSSAIADRVRWQLDGWLHSRAKRLHSESRPTSGIVKLVLAPDEVVAAAGRQLGFWGGESEADERARRALARVQAIIGAERVLVPEWRGGRSPDEQLCLVPADHVDLVERPPVVPPLTPPWPGRLPAPSPALVHELAPLVEVLDEDGEAVTINGRAMMSASPVALRVEGRTVPITAWAGPWPVDERWWDERRRTRLARLQVVTATGGAHLLTRREGQWCIEGTYD